ncbi:MAG: DUF2804 domain-containing protein [Rectinemataceae bacterium]
MEHEITASGSLHDAQGRLREPGWARSLLLDYDRDSVRAPKWRIKEWDYYMVHAGTFGIAFTVADNGYMGFVGATVFDFAQRAETSKSVMTVFPMGKMGLPRHSKEGVTEARAGGASLRFEASNGKRRLVFSWPGFGAAPGSAAPGSAAPGSGGPAPAPALDLSGEILLEETGPDSMVIATPFSGAARAFYYNQKINCQDATGSFRLGDRAFVLEKGRAFAVLDWGRGVWTWSNVWYWGSASGRLALPDGSNPRFGFNIGHGFGDTSAAGENMVFFEGRAHKIGTLLIEIDHGDFLAPWRARSGDGRFDLTLTPSLDRASSTNLLVIASIQHQVFGSWSGTVILDDGRKLEVRDFPGFCEKVMNRW